MPNIKSSKKDVISSKIAYEKNKADKSELKTNLKKFEAAVWIRTASTFMTFI